MGHKVSRLRKDYSKLMEIYAQNSQKKTYKLQNSRKNSNYGINKTPSKYIGRIINESDGNIVVNKKQNDSMSIANSKYRERGAGLVLPEISYKQEGLPSLKSNKSRANISQHPSIGSTPSQINSSHQVKLKMYYDALDKQRKQSLEQGNNNIQKVYKKQQINQIQQ